MAATFGLIGAGLCIQGTLSKSLITAAKGPAVPSRLMIFDLVSGQDRLLLKCGDLIEAPNWSPCGRFLVVNGNGRLFRVALDQPDLTPIETGHATACNNDHGISPDGTMLVISDKSRTEGSCIYTLPIGGSTTPHRITPNIPSYWHGWSPDGRTLAYCARRDGVFDIYTIPVEGGEETRLTDGVGHSDGPDYTPDGAWIWFNSSRSGPMHLWRIRPDGTGLEQMTDDDRTNWFPHPSPNGKTVLYLAYEGGVDGHPRDHDVELRAMGPDGGHIRTLVSLFGGQGSINVPCWSPDSRQFAYVRYEPD